VERSWLVAGLDAATARYGSIEGYLTEGLGLKESTLDRLRARLRGE
jgi:protein-tyrosine phosphatase